MRGKGTWSGLIGVASAALALGLWWRGDLSRWEHATWAWRAKAFARPGAATGRVRVILLDQQSLDWGKNEMSLPWPWPREVYAPILDFCERAKARAVIFDTLFTEPSYKGVEDDALLGRAIGRTDAFVGAVFLGDRDGVTHWPAAVPPPYPVFEGLAAWQTEVGRGAAASSRATFPIPEVATNALALGNVSDVPDEDGVFRRASAFRVFDGRAVPSVALAPYFAAARRREEMPEVALSGGLLRIGGWRVPIDRQGRALLRYRGGADAHRPVSAAAVIQSELRIESGEGTPTVDPSSFKDAYVFFGFSAPGLLDLRATPLSPVCPGVEVHATLLDNLLSGDLLADAPPWAAALSTLLLALAASAGVVYSRRASHSVIVIAVLLPLPLAVGYAAYARGWWWPVVPSGLAVGLSSLGGLVYRYATEGRQKAFIKQAFRHYLSPAWIDRILEDPSRLQLGGERKELTIFFSDLQGFSSFSERMAPTDLTQLLNDYLTDMTDLLLGSGGTLDKYEGDAIIAFWNAPIDQPDHAVRAVRTALACQRRLAERREEFRERYGAELRMRVGLHTGEVVVGNMGSRERFNYTMLGDAANLASRLEGANKAFGTYLMASESAWQATGGAFAGRELARLRVVGRHTPVRVFEPCGEAGAAPPADWAAFARALEAFYAGRFEEARAVFAGITGDPAAAAYASKCGELLAEPPGEWDGVWSLLSK